MRIHEKKIVDDGIVQHEVETSGEVTTTADVAEYQAAKTNQAVWFIVGLLELLLGLRVLLHLFGANQVGFTRFIELLTNPLVSGFVGMFPAPTVGDVYLDSAAIVAMVVVALIGWVIAALVELGNPRSV